jgi:plastocyanin
MVRRSLIILVAAVALALASLASAAPRQIDVNDDDTFAPKNPPARDFSTGPSFRWSNGGGSITPHNIRQNDKLFRSGALTRGPINFTINASAGSFRYYCELHGTPDGLGMAGVVKVRPIAVPDSLVGEIEVQWADSNTNTGSRFDVRYRVDHRRWKTWRNDTRSFHGAFGHKDSPVNYNPSRHNYKIKVRSERRRVTKRSDWSPVLSLG